MATSPSLAPRLAAAPTAAAVRAQNALWRIMPAALMLYASLLPQEFRLSFFGQILYAPRLAGFLLLPIVIHRLATQHRRLVPADALAAIAAAWMVVSFCVIYGFDKGFVRGMALAIDVLFPYFVARVSIGSLTDFRRLLVVFLPGLATVAAGMLLETLVQRPFMTGVFEQAFGPLPSAVENGRGALVDNGLTNARFGLLRVMGTLSHPILAGVYLGTAATLYYSSGLRGWPRLVGTLSGAAAIFTLSSAAFLAIFAGIALTTYDRVQKAFDFLNWKTVLAMLGVAVLALEIASNRGIIGLMGAFSLDPWTAYFRELTWDFGTASVAENPAFGIGFQAYKRLPWMVSSVDNYWLAIAIRHGLVAALALFFLSLTAAASAALASTRCADETDRRTCVGLAGVIAILTALEFTVFLFGGISAFHFTIVAAGVSVAHAVRSRAQG